VVVLLEIRIPAGLHFHSRVTENRREPFPRMMTEISYSGADGDRTRIKLSDEQQQELSEVFGELHNSIDSFFKKAAEAGKRPRPIRLEDFDCSVMDIITSTSNPEVIAPMLKAVSSFYSYNENKQRPMPKLMHIHDMLTVARASTMPDTKLEQKLNSLIDRIGQTMAFWAERRGGARHD